MKCKTETVWISDADEVLIRLANGAYTVVPAGCTTEKLRELGLAIDDALSRAAQQEENHA